ncbi:MAG: translocation/assembly module TamB domain-containing protein [Desulfosalsimonas sp.]
MIRRILKILVFSSVAIAALALVTAVSLQVFLNTETAANLIRKHLNAAIPGHIDWEEQNISIFTGKIRLHGLEVMDTENQKIITLKNMSADIGLTKLLSGTVLVESARFIQPAVFIETDAQGNLNLTRAFTTEEKELKPRDEEKKGAPALNVIIKSMEAENGTFSYTDAQDSPAGEANVFLDGLNVRISDANLTRKEGTLRFTVKQGAVDGYGTNIPIDGFFLEAELKNKKLAPLRLELESGKSSLAVSGSVSDIFTSPEPDLIVNASADLSEIKEILSLQQDLSGRVLLNASVKGNPANPEVTADLNSDGFVLAGTELNKIKMQILMQDRKLHIRELEADLLEGAVNASGTIDLEPVFPRGLTSPPADPETIECSLELRLSDLLVSQLPGMKNFSGRLSGRIGVESTGITPENIKADADAQFSLRGLSPDGKTGPFDIDISSLTRVETGQILIRKISAESSEFRINARGSYDISQNSLELETNAEIAEIDRLAEKSGVQGITGKKVTMSADISGNAAMPSVDAVLKAEEPGFRDIGIDSLEARIGFYEGGLDLSKVKIASNSSTAELSGTIQILDGETFSPEPDPAIDIAFKTNNMNMEDFLPQIRASVQAAGNIRGSLRNPEGTITAEAKNIETGVQKIEKLNLRSTIRDRRIHLEPLEVFLGEKQELKAEGWISPDRKYQISINSTPLALADMDFIEYAGLEGHAEISAQGKGSLENPGMEAVIKFTDLSTEGRDIPDVDITAELSDMKAALNISDPFYLNLDYDLGSRNFSVNAELPETELTPFFRVAGIEGFSGSFTGSLKAGGNTDNIENTNAQLNISDLKLRMDDREIASLRDFSASFEDRRIIVPENRIKLPADGYIDVHGTGSPDGNIDLTAEGVFPAELAEGIVPEIQSPKGRALLEARILGTFKEPDFSAQLILDNLECGLATTMQKLHSLNGQIKITKQGVTFSGISGKLDQGVFTVDGRIDLDAFAPVRADIDIRAENLPVNIPDMMDMRINAGLKLSGTPDESMLSGEITLLEGLYYKDVNMSLIGRARDLGRRTRRSSSRTEIEMPDVAFLRNLSLDISLGHKNPFIVDNNLALLTIRPQLALKGTAENPVLTGRAEIAEGNVAYRNTEFEVKKGIVDFVDPYSIEPELDIVAESRVRQWTITLAITGSPENLDFQLSSSPPEEDKDIISLLATGKTTREMAGSTGTTSGPEQMLANLLGERIEKQVRQGTGLDIVEVEYRQNGTSTDGENEQGVKITVGKELSRRLTVKYGVERKSGEMVQQTTGTYRLLENLSANAYQDTGGAFGGEMRYRLEFR